MVGLQTLNLAIGVRVPASQPTTFNKLRSLLVTGSNTLPLRQRIASKSPRQLIASNSKTSRKPKSGGFCYLSDCHNGRPTAVCPWIVAYQPALAFSMLSSHRALAPIRFCGDLSTPDR